MKLGKTHMLLHAPNKSSKPSESFSRPTEWVNDELPCLRPTDKLDNAKAAGFFIGAVGSTSPIPGSMVAFGTPQCLGPLSPSALPRFL